MISFQCQENASPLQRVLLGSVRYEHSSAAARDNRRSSEKGHRRPRHSIYIHSLVGLRGVVWTQTAVDILKTLHFLHSALDRLQSAMLKVFIEQSQ